MDRLTSHEVTVMFLALGILLAAAHVLGEVAKRLHQPAVVGEILAGMLLGPTVLGTLAPNWSTFLFPLQGRGALVLQGLTTLAPLSRHQNPGSVSLGLAFADPPKPDPTSLHPELSQGPSQLILSGRRGPGKNAFGRGIRL